MAIKTAINHKQRLRDGVKRLVIEMGYLERLDPDGKDLHLRLAKSSIDFAVDLLNKYLAEQAEL
jgi:hypothetical protein